MVGSTSIYQNLKSPDTKDSFEASTAPFAQAMHLDGESFFQWVMRPENLKSAIRLGEGVEPWLNASFVSWSLT